MKKMYMTASFSMPASMLDEFKNWMEQHHYKDVLMTGLFEYEVRRTLDTSDPAISKVCYRLEVRNQADWETYQEEHRPKFKGEFFDRWEMALKEKLLVAVVLFGEEEQLVRLT